MTAYKKSLMIAEYRSAMDEGRNSIQPALDASASKVSASKMVTDWAPFRRGVAWEVAVNTAVPLQR